MTHLERDDMGVISGAYKAAKAAYAGSADNEPQELSQWKDAIAAVKTDLIVWGSADMTGGVGKHSSAALSKTLADLDKTDELVNAFAPASVRAVAAASAAR
ncbi:hypothetical protein [Arthrobacter sp. UYCo732]|uniref:hypothetical protein n=1 Tax=Arthrobacter sp. UYCo732 TaxID=3156336 RepID=UPI003395100C